MTFPNLTMCLADDNKNDIDSFMYQTAGYNAIEAIAEAMELPLVRRRITGSCKQSDMYYTEEKGDEVEDLFAVLKEVKTLYPEVDAVSSGAIWSSYQRVRVEDVCYRLGLTSLAYLWGREQMDLLKEMIDSDMNCILIKVAAMGI